jgi:uroporphyrinogen decarboxylase
MGEDHQGMTTNTDWIKATLAHRGTGAVPYNFMFSPPALALVREHYGCEDVGEGLDLPLRMTGTVSVKPLYAPPTEFGETVVDEFGVVWSTSEIDRGSPIGPPLVEPDLSHYTFPDPTASYRFEGLDEWCRRNEGSYRIIWVGDLWERATFMRGMEALLVDLALRPAFVEELLRGLTDHIRRTMTILFERFSFEGIAVSDDYGTQKALLMSPAHWRRFIRPCLAEIYRFAKERGRTVFHHSCGHVEPIAADFVEIGLDVLHPIQPEANDIRRLKREYGRVLTFCGGVRTQDLLPYGMPDEVRAEVRRLKRDMGAGGGYILEPGITLQADVPAENLFALIDEARA